ncbi:hypothetical protein [Massilia sp. Leaf139]|uniref:hypothetical protein n=1 Tax=Massilia sp. Leaf139 TaxID=1736272 RepID=UPI0006F932CF|nr:hypothetical protein [Massilia sp. Leaf139]KQQ91693.1 hypothetical protein ASF77_07115 [Massilia sp. Leaf139]
MDMVFCPGCAGDAQADLESGTAACPVCGAPRAACAAPGARRNPFRLIALCLLWAVGFWVAGLFLAAALALPQHEVPGGPLLLAAIGLSIVLTVRGSLPGTAKPLL